jgi:hypothetical protein
MYTLCCWMQGKSAKPKRPTDPIEGSLFDTQQYFDLSMLRHCINYKIISDGAEDYRKQSPTREEYDTQKGLPDAYASGDPIDVDELSQICNELDHDLPLVVEAIKRNPHLAINYLRIRYWDHLRPAEATTIS